MRNNSIIIIMQGGWRLWCLAVTKVNFNEHLEFMILNIFREEAVLYLTREKDEEALLDFITTSFVFPDNETVDEKEEPDVASDEEIPDSDEAEEEEGKEFVAKVSENLFVYYWWWDSH